MAATILFWNNSKTTIASAVGPTDTTVTLAPGSGALFSPGPTGGQYGMGTFTDALTGIQTEIVKITGVSGDVLTIVRAQEGTSAQSWSVGDNFQGRVTAGALEDMQGLTVAHADEADKWTTARNLSLTGDGTASLASVDGTTDVSAALTLATVNTNVGSFGDASHAPNITINGKGLITAASSVLITPAAIGAPPNNRTIATTSPLTGGGDLSANRTLAWDFTAAAPFTGNITVPTQASTDNSTKAASTAYVVSRTPLSQEYGSGQFSYTNASIHTFTHGLSITNGVIIQLQAICQSAEHGYTSGDALILPTMGDSNSGVSVNFTTTTVNVTVTNNGIPAVDKGTFANFTLTPANWKLLVIMLAN